MTNDTAPQNPSIQTAEKLTAEQIRKLYPPFLVEKLSPEQVMKLAPEVLVQLLSDKNCGILTINTAKKIESDAVIGTLMPNLIVPAQNGNPAAWNKAVDLDGDGVEHHELLAALVRGSQIAHERGVNLRDVKVEELDCKDLQPISQKLIDKKGPQVC